MLWTDADPVTTADLLSLDPEILDIAQAETIVVEGANSVVRRGVEEAGQFLERRMVTFGTFGSSGGVSANHLAAVFNVGFPTGQKQRATLGQVVIDWKGGGYWSPLRSWVAHVVLKRFYLAAMNRAVNDRYQVKFERFARMVQYELWPSAKKQGIPMVYRPLPCPAAAQEYLPGTFAVSQVAGSGTVDAIREIAVTYVDESQTTNGESYISARASLTLTSGNVARVDIANLNPPTGVLTAEMSARGVTQPLNATGWNVYVGLEDGTLYKQNSSVIPIATKTYTLVGNPTSNLAPAGMGQYPNTFLTIMDLLERG